MSYFILLKLGYRTKSGRVVFLMSGNSSSFASNSVIVSKMACLILFNLNCFRVFSVVFSHSSEGLVPLCWY